MSAGRLILVTARFPFGSQEAYLNVELAELARYFDDVVVVPARPPASQARYSVPSNVTVLDWPLVNPEILRRAAAAAAVAPLRAVRTFAKILSSRDPGRLKNLAVFVKGLALGQWAAEHRADHIHAYWMSTPSTVAMVAASTSKIPWSATAHRWDIYERNAFDVKERSVEYVRAISARGAQDLRARMPRLDGRIAHLRLGIEIPPYAAVRRSRAGFRIVCPAALVPVKGHCVLFAALSQLKESGVPVHCTLFGTGPLQNELESASASRGLRDQITFGGFIPQNRLHELYREGSFDVIVLASRNAGEKMMEGVPSALLEAMAFGVPIVATNSGSVREAIDGQSGLLVPSDNPSALAAALFDVYRNPETARARAEHAYALVAQRHDVRAQMRDLAAALHGKERAS
ncbi:MAG TPA: glycosyltransferase family 4 protein [Candidatus Cybelea sp.]|nr:glycosyltransferase family 4 protein [Candidatus Cybelea sp.]